MFWVGAKSQISQQSVQQISEFSAEGLCANNTWAHHTGRPSRVPLTKGLNTSTRPTAYINPRCSVQHTAFIVKKAMLNQRQKTSSSRFAELLGVSVKYAPYFLTVRNGREVEVFLEKVGPSWRFHPCTICHSHPLTWLLRKGHTALTAPSPT